MRAFREWKLMPWLARAPVALLGVALAASALQAGCVGIVDSGEPPDAGAGEAATDASEDSPDDRADGMSYGDGYGAPDAGTRDGDAGGP